MPRRVLIWAFVALLVLGVGGALLERSLGTSSLQRTATAPTTPAPTIPLATPGLAASLPAFLNIVVESGKAPAFSLSNPLGQPITIRALAGRVVLVSFFGARCNDICPVVAAELKIAGGRLGAERARVAFLTINVDPGATSLSAARLAGIRSTLSALPGWQFLTASLSSLNGVWSSYGIAVDYQPSSGAIAHTEAIYLIDPGGRLRYRFTPFANETSKGHYQLNAASLHRFGDGIASYISFLLRQASGT